MDPRLFIENGKIKEHSGERMKRGPGVLWLDFASGAVTRTAVAIRQTMGPGVHFMNGRIRRWDSGFAYSDAIHWAKRGGQTL